MGCRRSLVTSPELVGAILKLAIFMEDTSVTGKKETGRSRVERWRCCGHLGSLVPAVLPHSLRIPQDPSTKAPFLLSFWKLGFQFSSVKEPWLICLAFDLFMSCLGHLNDLPACTLQAHTTTLPWNFTRKASRCSVPYGSVTGIQ